MTGGNPSSEGKRVKSLEKASNIIKLLEKNGGSSVSEVASSLDMPSSTVYLYLKTLQDIGYVLKSEGEYKLSLKFLETGSRVRQRHGVFQAARQELLALHQRTGQRIGLGVEEQGKRVQLWQMDGKDDVYDDNFVGEYTHLHWTSLGKVLLADFDDEEVKQIVEEQGLPRATDRTITDVNRLFEEINQVRAQNYAIEDEERKPGMRSVSVPLIDAEGNTRAAIGVAAAKSQLDSQTCSEYIELLHEKANLISIRYNY